MLSGYGLQEMAKTCVGLCDIAQQLHTHALPSTSRLFIYIKSEVLQFSNVPVDGGKHSEMSHPSTCKWSSMLDVRFGHTQRSHVPLHNKAAIHIN